MTKYNFPIYGKPGEIFCIEVENPPEQADYYDVLELAGYNKIRLCSPYFYYNAMECAFVELFRLGKHNGGCILSLWDHNRALHEFYCEDDHAELELMSKLISMMKDMVIMEYHLKLLDTISEDEINS